MLNTSGKKSENHPYEYGTGPDAYLDRAYSLIAEDTSNSMFYAAYELRCYVEARQDQYLTAIEEYLESIPRSWRIGSQGKALENLNPEAQIQKIAWSIDGKLVLEAYHVPVSRRLRNLAEQFGNLLHAQGKLRAPSDIWWKNTRKTLIEAYNLSYICSSGILLSPVLLDKGNIIGTFVLRENNGDNLESLLKVGARGTMTVNYLEKPPESWANNSFPQQ